MWGEGGGVEEMHVHMCWGAEKHSLEASSLHKGKFREWNGGREPGLPKALLPQDLQNATPSHLQLS